MRGRREMLYGLAGLFLMGLGIRGAMLDGVPHARNVRIRAA